MMPELLPDEMEVFDIGREIKIPASLTEGQFCFHLCIWFLTGSIPDLPEAPTYSAYIRQHLAELKSMGASLWKDPPFEATSVEDLKPPDGLICLPKGVYLIHLYDRILDAGHWVVLTDTGVFEPGVNRIEIPLDKWVSLFQKRYGVRRAFPTSGRVQG
jgi:hypothetical protein